MVGEITRKILEVIEESGKIEKRELIRKVGEHPGVVRMILKKLVKEGKIKEEKKKVPHNPTKFVVYYSL